MSDRISINEWITNFDNGEYDKDDFDTQCKVGWFDWFCNDSKLRNKTYKLAPKIKVLAKILGAKFCDTHYLFFKNNCPMSGSLYDDFRFCDIETGDVVFTIIPKSGFHSEKGKSIVWGYNIKGKFKELVRGNWKEVIEWFKNN